MEDEDLAGCKPEPVAVAGDDGDWVELRMSWGATWHFRCADAEQAQLATQMIRNLVLDQQS